MGGRCIGARTSRHHPPLMYQTGAPSRLSHCPAHHPRLPSAASLVGGSNRCPDPTDRRPLRHAVWYAWWSHSHHWYKWLRCPLWMVASHHNRPPPGGGDSRGKSQLAGAGARVVKTVTSPLSSTTNRTPLHRCQLGTTPWQRPWLIRVKTWHHPRKESPSATSLPAGSWRCHQLPEKLMTRPST